MPSRPHSLKQIAQQAHSFEAWGLGLSEFLDEVNVIRALGDSAALLALIRDEPPPLHARFEQGETADAFAAALAEHLALSVSAPAPAWTRERERFLPQAWFPLAHIAEHPRLRELIEQQTPRSFREHNIFIDEDSLART